MAGTYGSLLAVALLLPLIMFSVDYASATLSVVILLAYFAGIWSIAPAVERLSRQSDHEEKPLDHNHFVVDEMLGVWVSALPLLVFTYPHPYLTLALAFLMFRLLDIAKPGPLSRIDAEESAHAFMDDDLIAGGFTALVITALHFAIAL